jgi:hypothetical protein
MKDLYKRLNITPTAFAPEIREALSGIRDEDLRKRTEGILLQPKRRQVYDKNHDLLSKISELRANLGVNHGEFWGSGDFSDFTTEPTQIDTETEKLVNAVRATQENPYKVDLNEKGRSPWGCFIIFGILMLIGYFSDDDQTKTNDHREAPRRESAGERRGFEESFSEPAVPWGDWLVETFGVEGAGDWVVETLGVEGGGEESFSEPAVPAPANGYVFFEKESYGDKAPFEIKTPWGSGDHIIKLKDWSTGELFLSAFVLEGASFETEVPLGAYRLQYASGDSWYGIEHLFGPDTVYGQAESQLRFFNNGINLMGQVVELIPQRGGNLRTGRISAGDF